MLAVLAASPAFAVERAPPACCILFRPLDRQPDVSRESLIAKWNVGLGRAETDEPDALVNALVDYEFDPNVRTALTALDQQFKVLAGNDDLRGKAFAVNLDLFLTLDVLKFELPLQAALRLNQARHPKARAIFSYRVGSSGQRFLEILQWRQQGGDLSQIAAALGDRQYVLSKLGKSDDDLTNTALREAIVDDPVLNETLNGKRATDEIAVVSGAWGHAIDFKTVKTEFLSPTKAYSILRLRPPGAEASFPSFQAAYIAADEEKYRGLSAEEQLHDWGTKAGIAIDLRNLTPDSNADAVLAATKAYADTPELMQMNGRYEFSPAGVRDLFGWVANNHRQIADVHDGTLQDYAKYFIRDADWWARLGFGNDPPGGTVVEIGAGQPGSVRLATSPEMGDYGIDFASGDFKAALELARAIRSPESAEQLAAAIEAAGGRDEALQRFVDLENRLVEASHRRNVDKVTAGLREALVALKQQDGAIAEDLPIETLLAGNDELRHSLEVLATAYTNFSDEAVEQLRQQLAEDIRRTVGDEEADGTAVHGAIVRKYLILALQKAREAAARTRAEAGDFAEIGSLVKALEGDLEQHTGEIADRVKLDLFMDDVIAGRASRERLVFEWKEGELPRVFFAEVQVQPEDVRRDLQDLKALSDLLYWDQKSNIDNLYQFFASGTDETRTRRVVDASREAVALFDPARMPARPARLTDHNGETVYFEVRPNRVEAGLNLGLVALKMSIKDVPRMVQGGWKIWGDVADAKALGDNLIEIFKPTPGLNPELRAKAHAMALSKTISLFEYAEWISSSAKNPWVFQTFGTTLSTAASFAADPFDKDAPKLLAQAAIKDLLLWVQPELAVAFVAYDITNWGMQTAKLSWARSGMVDLLVENGDWQTETDDGIPVLKGVFLNEGVTLVDDAAKRRLVCSGKAPPRSVGLMGLAKHPLAGSGMVGGVLLKKSGQRIEPRELFLDIFGGEGYDRADQVLTLVLDAIDVVHGGPVQTETRKWTEAWLRTMGVDRVPTNADDISRTPGDIVFDPAAPDWVSDGSWLTGGYVHELAGAKEGIRRHFALQVSEYWVRRQFIIECAVLDKLITEAVKRKQDELVEEIDLSDIADEMADLIRRMEALDRRVWPEIADSTGPFEGARYKPETDIPLTKDYLAFVAQLTAFLEQAIAFSRDPTSRLNPVTERRGGEPPSIEQQKQDLIELRDRARTAVRRMVGFVREYEDAYEQAADSVLRRLAGGNALATTLGGAGKGIDLRKYHIPLRRERDWVEWDQPLPFMVDEAVAVPTAADPELSRPGRKPMGTKDKFVAKTWEESYQGQKDTVRSDLGTILQGFDSRLRPIAEKVGLRQLRDLGGQLLHSVLQLSEWWQSAGPYERAEHHPYWPDLLLLRIQVEKLQNLMAVLSAADEIKRPALEEEAVAAIKQMYLEGLPRTPETTPIDNPGSDYAYAADLVAKMLVRYDELLKLADNMIDIKIKVTPAESDGGSSTKLRVTDMASFAIELEQNKRLNGPLPADFSKLVGYYRWELVPVEESGTPADNEACLFSTSEEYWFTENVEQKPDTPDRNLRWRKRLIQAGKFRLRVTALSHGGVPLAQSEERDILVYPVNITGRLKTFGEWDSDTDPVSLFLGPASRIAERARFRLVNSDLTEDGDFEKPLCIFETGEIPVAGTDEGPDGAPPGPFPPDPFAAYAGVITGSVVVQPTVTSSGFVSPVTIPIDPRSRVVPVSFVAGSAGTPGKFKLDEDLELHFKRGVTIEVEVVDASDTRLEGAEITLSVGDQSQTGPGPFAFDLKKGDRISGTVRYARGGIEIERPTRTIVYDPARSSYDATGREAPIRLKVGLPFFDFGNLRVSGVFVPPAGGDATTVAGGVLQANILGGQTAGVASGGGFDVSNAKPVLLEDGLAIDAILRDQDDRLLRPAGGRIAHRLAPLPGGHLDLGSIATETFTITVSGIRLEVIDWAGSSVPVGDATVTIGEHGQQMTPLAAAYESAWSFSKFNETVEITASLAMPTGAPVEDTLSVSFDDLGGPLDPHPPETPFEIRLPAYLPGSLAVTGRTEARMPSGVGSPSGVDLTLIQGDPTLADDWSETVGNEFRLEISVPVRGDAELEVAATARAGDASFAGRGSARPPAGPFDRPVTVSVGVIYLDAAPPSGGDEAGEPPGEPDCAAAQAAYDDASRLYQAGDLDAAEAALDRGRVALAELGDPQACADLRDGIARAGEAIDRLRRTLAGIDATIAACRLSEMDRVAGTLERLTSPHRLLADKTRVLFRARTAVREATTLIDQARAPFLAKRHDEVSRLLARATAKLDSIADLSRCPDLRTRIAQISADNRPTSTETPSAGGDVEYAHFVISVEGQGFTPHWAGASYEKSGMHYQWLTIPVDADHDRAKADLEKAMLSGGCDAVNPPGFPGFAEPPIYWQRGPELTTIKGPLVRRDEYTEPFPETWKILRDDGPPLHVLKGKVSGAGDCG